jgi:hypothetical protein
MVVNTLQWRKAYGTDAIAADDSIPECLHTIARLGVRLATLGLHSKAVVGATALCAFLSTHARLAHTLCHTRQGRARSGHQVLWFEYGPLASQEAWGAHPAGEEKWVGGPPHGRCSCC